MVKRPEDSAVDKPPKWLNQPLYWLRWYMDFLVIEGWWQF